MTPEGKVKKSIKDLLESFNIRSFKESLSRIEQGLDIDGYYSMPVPGTLGESGVADFVVCYLGSYIEIEAKSEKGSQRGIQKAHEKVIRASDGKYILVKGEKDLYKVENLLSNLRLDYADRRVF